MSVPRVTRRCVYTCANERRLLHAGQSRACESGADAGSASVNTPKRVISQLLWASPPWAVNAFIPQTAVAGLEIINGGGGTGGLGAEVPQRDPRPEPRWVSAWGEAAKSWRLILKITIANIISRDRGISMDWCVRISCTRVTTTAPPYTRHWQTGLSHASIVYYVFPKAG